MRYFRDLGVDAHLFLYSNDGSGSNSHFRPEYDTWEIERWAPFIHQTTIHNGPLSVVGFPYNLIAYGISIVTALLNGSRPLPSFPSRKKTQKAFEGFDGYIGSGITPALFFKNDLELDIFYPYGTGVEFACSRRYISAIRNANLIEKNILVLTQQAQIRGIRKAKFCINAELSLTKECFKKIGKNFFQMTIPMVYNRDEISPKLNMQLKTLLSELSGYECTIISHASHQWINPGTYTSEEWEKRSKNNNWLINGYSEFIQARPEVETLLLIVEYGPDVEHSKKLCDELGISHKVRWLPKMKRKELMMILQYCNIGVGEFYNDKGVIWGGTGWEVLSAGKPLLQGFQFEENEFEDVFGHPPPPMLPVKSQRDICMHFIEMVDNPEKARDIGKAAYEWFNQYNGIGLAKQWLELIILSE